MEELEKNETSTQAEENTVSLASAQALADALAKIEAYTPTTWVDNSSPDIDAEHLNKPEQAIKRVTDALNSAVDVIKNLQSQVTKNAGDISTVNNNLSNKADKTSLSSYALKSDLLNLSRTFVSGDSFSDAKDLSIPPGIYGVNPGLKNIPENTYGLLEVTADTVNNWRFLKFTPTNIKSHYLMFYNGYDKTWSEWAHFASTT